MKEIVKVSAIEVVKQLGFVQTGTENGVPVYELKKEQKCETCGKTAQYCECEDNHCG